MGGLINTVGTRLLIEHFNMEFRGNRLRDIRTEHPIADPSGQVIQEYFKTHKDLWWLTDNIRHLHSTSPLNKCFLPARHKEVASPNAFARWSWFIQNPTVAGALTTANHTLVCDAIYIGLTHNSSIGSPFDRIEFDAVDGTSAGLQTVLHGEEWDRNGLRYYKVVLVTPPIPQTAGGGRQKLDDQPGDP